MRFYVYALIDPRDGNKPFYIGKGMDNRLQSHFKQDLPVSQLNDESAVVGCDTRSIVAHAQHDSTDSALRNQKLKKIAELKSSGFDHTHIARILARRLDESTALAVEACLIKSIYGIGNLTNQVVGEHSERFRPYNVWEYMEGFDQGRLTNGTQFSGYDHPLGKYYVYVLRDPRSNEVFYVGKGTGNRQGEHFPQAVEATRPQDDALKLKKIRELLGQGLKPHDVGRIVARVEDEGQAFALEALFVKFVYGFNYLTNIQAGHHSGLFRAKDDWEKRKGFDLPFVVDPGTRGDRSEKLDLMLGEGLDAPLMEIQDAFPNLRFDRPKVLDASDLGIEADVGNARGQAGARIKIFIRKRRIQAEVRWRKQAQRQWIISHFSKLGAYPLRRDDDVFFPTQWKGPANMTEDVGEAIRRVGLLLQIVSAERRQDLTEEAIELLPGQ